MLSARYAIPVIADDFVGRSSGAAGQCRRAPADRHDLVPRAVWCLRIFPLEAFPHGLYDCLRDRFPGTGSEFPREAVGFGILDVSATRYLPRQKIRDIL